MAELYWTYDVPGFPGLAYDGEFFVPDDSGVVGRLLPTTYDRIRQGIRVMLLPRWLVAPVPEWNGDSVRDWLHRDDLPRPVPHIRSAPVEVETTHAGSTRREFLPTGRLLLEVTSRWPAGSLAIPDDRREALGDALSCSDMPAESWRYLPWSEEGREACPTGPPWPSAPTVLCRPCGDRPLRSLIVMLGREPLWGAFCDRCCTVYWTRREAVVASVDVDLRPRAGLLPGTVTIGDREVPARVVVVTNELPGDLFDRTAFERDMAILAARERIARGEARPEDTDATLFWSRPRRPRSG
jgi:hypothetical protein